MSDANETPIGLDEAREQIPGHPSLPTIWRWCRFGFAGVKLECQYVGRRCYTTPSAIKKFLEQMNGLRAAMVQPTLSPRRKIVAPRTRAPKVRQRAIDNARAKLATA